MMPASATADSPVAGRLRSGRQPPKALNLPRLRRILRDTAAAHRNVAALPLLHLNALLGPGERGWDPAPESVLAQADREDIGADEAAQLARQLIGGLPHGLRLKLSPTARTLLPPASQPAPHHPGDSTPPPTDPAPRVVTDLPLSNSFEGIGDDADDPGTASPPTPSLEQAAGDDQPAAPVQHPEPADPAPPAIRTVLFRPLKKGRFTDITATTVARGMAAAATAVGGRVTATRVNCRLNIAAADTRDASAVDALLATTTLAGVPVRGYRAAPSSRSRGLVDRLNPAERTADIRDSLESGVPVVGFHRLGGGRRARILFGGPLPTHVTLWGYRLPVREEKPRPFQCGTCGRIGHVRTACDDGTACATCRDRHPRGACPRRAAPECPNCGGGHSAFVRSCPAYQRARAVAVTRAAGATWAEAEAIQRRREATQPPRPTGTAPPPPAPRRSIFKEGDFPPLPTPRPVAPPPHPKTSSEQPARRKHPNPAPHRNEAAPPAALHPQPLAPTPAVRRQLPTVSTPPTPAPRRLPRQGGYTPPDPRPESPRPPPTPVPALDAVLDVLHVILGIVVGLRTGSPPPPHLASALEAIHHLLGPATPPPAQPSRQDARTTIVRPAASTTPLATVSNGVTRRYSV